MHIESIRILKNQINQNINKLEELSSQISILLAQKEELNDLTNSIQESIKVLGQENMKIVSLNPNPTSEKALLEAIPEVPEMINEE